MDGVRVRYNPHSTVGQRANMTLERDFRAIGGCQPQIKVERRATAS